MRISAIRLCFMLAVPGAPVAQELCGVAALDLASLRAKVAAQPDAKPTDSRSPDFDVISVGQGQIWNFTKPRHPAHPSVACRMLLQRDGQFFVETKLRCQASKERCDMLAADYARLDKEMTQAVKARSGNK